MNASQKRIMRTRLGQQGFQGSRPWAPWSKVLVTRTAGVGEAPGTLCGWHFAIPVNNWNDPMAALGDLVAGTSQKVQDRHPIHHNDAIADGYDMVQVLSSKIQVEIMWNVAADVTSGRMTWGYAFSSSLVSPFAHTAGSGATIELLNMVSDPRWTTGSMLADPNHRAVVINVNIPSVLQYGKVFHGGSVVFGDDAFGAGLMAHPISDTSTASLGPIILVVCHFVLFNNAGLATAISSTRIRVEHEQKVRIMRNMTTADLDQTPDTHS